MSNWRALYPFESHWLPMPAGGAANMSNAPRMHYVEQGQGPHTIVCVHGNPTWSFYYRTIVQQQSSRARVIAVDHIGCGLSDKPQAYPYTLDQHIANLKRLVVTLDLQNVTLVVHDWGGAIGLGTALEVADRIKGIVLLNTGAFPPPFIPLRISACRIPLLGQWGMRGLNLFARAALSMTLARLPRLDSDVAAGLIAPYDSWNNRIAIANFVRDIPTRDNQPTMQRLKQIEAGLPTLNDRALEIVWGMRDWCFTPECLQRFEQLLPAAHVTRLDDVGHYVMEEASEEVNQAVVRCLEAQQI